MWIPTAGKMDFELKQYPWFYIIHYLSVLRVSPEQVSISSLSRQTPATWWLCSGCPSRTVPQQAGQPAGHRHQVTHGNIVRSFSHSGDSGYNIEAHGDSTNAHLCYDRQVILRMPRITLKYAVYNVTWKYIWQKCHGFFTWSIWYLLFMKLP